MSIEPRFAAILFADIAGFSKSKEERLLSQVQSILNDFSDSQVDKSKCFHKKTWGDALVLACHDPNDTLEYALLLRDRIRNHNWRRQGFSQHLSIRIGLHSGLVSIMTDGVNVRDISGTQVNLAARIEPIVPPDAIFCSEAFYVLVKDATIG